MKNKLLTTTLLLTIAGFSSSVMAGINSPVIDKKQEKQKDRIVQGVTSGSLTGKETWRLSKQQKHIYQEERRFKADGHFTRRERAKVHMDLTKASVSIYKQKHDRQYQGGRHQGIHSPWINKRERHQAKRIGQGVKSGALTWKETAHLGKQQARIHRQERRFKADGTFTRKERARIHKRQNKASKNIYRAKHNNKHR